MDSAQALITYGQIEWQNYELTEDELKLDDGTDCKPFLNQYLTDGYLNSEFFTDSTEIAQIDEMKNDPLYNTPANMQGLTAAVSEFDKNREGNLLSEAKDSSGNPLSFDQKIKLLNQLKHKLVRVDGYQQAKENYEQFISGQKKQVGDLQASQQVMEQLCENPSERSAVLKDLFTKTFDLQKINSKQIVKL